MNMWNFSKHAGKSNLNECSILPGGMSLQSQQLKSQIKLDETKHHQQCALPRGGLAVPGWCERYLTENCGLIEIADPGLAGSETWCLGLPRRGVCRAGRCEGAVHFANA